MAIVTNIGPTRPERRPIVGREAELALIEDFLRSERGARALVLSGPAGIGKSALCEAGVGLAGRRGIRVLTASPSEGEAQLSFAALSDLFADLDMDELSSLPTPQRGA